MAQLRDKQTSEVVFEGTPTECVLLADQLGNDDETLYDDVGSGFDADAVRQAFQARKDDDPKAAKAQENQVSKAVSDAQARLTEARARTEA